MPFGRLLLWIDIVHAKFVRLQSSNSARQAP